MTCRLLCVVLAASLLATPAGAASKKAAKGGLDSTLANASEFCERAATRPVGTGFPLPAGGGVAIHDGAPPAMGTPDLVKRFAQTQPSARLASGPPFNLHFFAKGADVWAIVYDGIPTCEIMVTGASGDMPAVASRLAESLRRSGWRIAEASPATAARPFAQHVLLKKIPKPGAADYGLRLRLRAMSGASAAPEGIQLEMSFLAGEAGISADADQP